MNKIAVPALIRAQTIYLALLRSPWAKGISEISRDTDLNKSTVHGLVHTMTDMGLLEREGEDGKKFRPAGPILALWREAMLKGPLVEAAQPLLTAFSERHELTTLAGVFFQARVLIVEAVLAPGIAVSAYAGQLVPAWAGALGKVLLSTLPPRLARNMAPGMAARGPLGVQDYLDEVRQTRMTGVALDREEYLKGVRALAAAVPRGETFGPLAAVWAVGLAPSLEDERLEGLRPELFSLAQELGWRIGDIEEHKYGLTRQKK